MPVVTGEHPPTPFACHDTPLQAADCDRRTELAGAGKAAAIGRVLIQVRGRDLAVTGVGDRP